MRVPAVGISLIMAGSILAATPAVRKQYLLYHPVELSDTVLRSHAIASPASEIVIEARCAVSSDLPRHGGISKCSWGIGITGPTVSESVEIEVRRHTDFIDDINGGRRLHLTATLCTADSSLTIAQTDVEKGVSLTGGENTLMVVLRDRNCSIAVGDRFPSEVLSFPFPFDTNESVEPYFRCSGTVIPSVFVVESSLDAADVLKTTHDVDSLLKGVGFSTNRIDGLWKYLDRENDNDYARPGGYYKFATVTDSGKTDIIYLDGAEVADDKWRPGMLKGSLTSTVFLNHYDLTWMSASMENLEGEMFADLSDDGTILTLSFPELKSKMRFQRIPISDN